MKLFFEECKEAGLKARGSKILSICKSQNKLFDEECETEKENLQSLGEKIYHNTNNSDLRQLVQDKKRRFKQTCRRKKREYFATKACLISICRTPKRPAGDKQEKSLT